MSLRITFLAWKCRQNVAKCVGDASQLRCVMSIGCDVFALRHVVTLPSQKRIDVDVASGIYHGPELLTQYDSKIPEIGTSVLAHLLVRLLPRSHRSLTCSALLARSFARFRARGTAEYFCPIFKRDATLTYAIEFKLKRLDVGE